MDTVDMILCQRVEISLPLHVGDPTFTRVLDEVPQIQPFGAPVLVDYFVKDRDSEVVALVRYTLNFHDQSTSFFCLFPTKVSDMTDHGTDASTSCTGIRNIVCHVPDFERIARRSLRPHPTCDLSDSWRTTQAKCQAERFNRLYVQGTRTLLTSSGLSESWWPSATAQCAGFRFYFQQRWLCFLRAMFS